MYLKFSLEARQKASEVEELKKALHESTSKFERLQIEAERRIGQVQNNAQREWPTVPLLLTRDHPRGRIPLAPRFGKLGLQLDELRRGANSVVLQMLGLQDGPTVEPR